MVALGALNHVFVFYSTDRALTPLSERATA